MAKFSVASHTINLFGSVPFLTGNGLGTDSLLSFYLPRLNCNDLILGEYLRDSIFCFHWPQSEAFLNQTWGCTLPISLRCWPFFSYFVRISLIGIYHYWWEMPSRVLIVYTWNIRAQFEFLHWRHYLPVLQRLGAVTETRTALRWEISKLYKGQ